MSNPTFIHRLSAAQRKNNSLLCVGLDPDPLRFPSVFSADKDAIFNFCAQIVNATHDLVLAYKPQIAYFAAQRAEEQLERLIRHIQSVAPDIPVILDAKRGDIGATSAQYAIEAFERYAAHAVTLSPYMGFDSVEPYLKYRDKGIFLLCRTSNPGGGDLQDLLLNTAEGQPRLYEHIAHLAQHHWNASGQLGLVVGATFPDEIAKVRAIAPSLPLLIPGIGAQGGDALATVRAAAPGKAPILINSSRAILYADPSKDFASAARQVALQTRDLLNSA